MLDCQEESGSNIYVSNFERDNNHTYIYDAYRHLRQHRRGEFSIIKRSRHSRRNCTLHEAEDSVLWGTLIRAQKIAMSLETTQRTGDTQGRVSKDYLEVDQKNYTGNDKQGRDTWKQKEKRKVNFKKKSQSISTLCTITPIRSASCRKARKPPGSFLNTSGKDVSCRALEDAVEQIVCTAWTWLECDMMAGGQEK